jgi:nucleotide-binding universal stress UspA family protein/hemerythrin-like domain-containing protein
MSAFTADGLRRPSTGGAMYRHLLVPLDGSDLSIQIVGQSIEFARTLGARITFFHAAPRGVAAMTGEDVVWSTVSTGEGSEVLAKAEAAARAHDVPCRTVGVVDDKPYEAILNAARDAGCDLIYMASHGRASSLGMMIGSQTIRVLTHTEIPVLVAATRNPEPTARALGIIRDEHRSLAAVLHAWIHLLQGARADGKHPERELLRAIVYYIRDFPLTQHHPKEDDYLFQRLRQRTSSVNAELDELQRQHERDHQMVAELAALVEQVPLDLAKLEDAVQRYARFIWDHMGREEGVILPAAQRYLSNEDWIDIDQAFASNNDPRFSGETDLQYRRLLGRIVSLAKRERR